MKLLLTIITVVVLFPGCTTKEIDCPSGYYFTLPFFSDYEVNSASNYAARKWPFCGHASAGSGKNDNRVLYIECCVDSVADSASYFKIAKQDAYNLVTSVFRERLQDKDKRLQSGVIVLKFYFFDPVTGAMADRIDYSFSFPDLIGYIG